MKKKLLAAAITLGMGIGSAQALVIDSFNDVTTAEIGSRDISITKTGPLNANAQVISPPGIFTHSADALTSATSVIDWTLTPSPQDLTEGLVDGAFVLDILSIDQGNVELILSVNGTDVTLSGLGVGQQTVPFADFAGVDFTNVSSLSLTVVGAQSSDLTLDQFSTIGNQPTTPPPPPPTVPEPGILFLLGAGLLGMFGARRRSA